MQLENGKTPRTPSENVKVFLKGTVVGGSMLIPGLSGGTMAIILGIYDKLVHSVSTITENFKAKFLFLMRFALGAVVGILALSRVVLALFETFENPMRCFFSGVILGSLPAIIAKSKCGNSDKASPRTRRAEGVVCVLIGLGVCMLITAIPTGLLNFDGKMSLKGLAISVLSGLVIAVALVLPGISASHILLVLGAYETVLNATKELNFTIIIPIVISVGVGTMLTTSTLERAMASYPRQTYMCIVGFVLASVREVAPIGVASAPQAVASLLCFVCGVMAISVVSRLAKKLA